MNKWKKITLLVLGLIIIALIIGLIIVNNKPKINLVTTQDFINNYNNLNKNNNKVYPIKNHQIKNETKKDTYLFDDKFYLVIGHDKEQLDKVYLYTSKDTNYNNYLINMLKSINPNLSDKEVKEVFTKLTDIDGKKADELGFLVNFELDGYNYMTIEKENGKVISFFVYQPLNNDR